MDFTEQPRPPEQDAIRQVGLFQGERIEQVFVSDQGLVDATPAKGPLLVLTSQRVVAFSRQDERQETTMVPLEELKGASLRSHGRSLKNLYQGLALVVVGILAYPLIGLFIITSGSPLIPAGLAAIIIVVGVMMMSRYFFWEEEGSISFMAFHEKGSWELTFPFRGKTAGRDSSKVVNRFFELKLEGDQHPKEEKDSTYWPFR